MIYTVLHMFRQVLFGAGNQSNHQNFKKSLLSCKCGLIFIGMKQKKIFFLKNKIQNGRLKKTGRQAVRGKLKKWLKLPFLCF